jgi:hypothetical protein
MHMPLTCLYLMRPKSEYEVHPSAALSPLSAFAPCPSLQLITVLPPIGRRSIIPAPVHRHNSENVFSSTPSRQEQRRSFCGSAVHDPSCRLVAVFDRSWFPNSGVS